MAAVESEDIIPPVAQASPVDAPPHDIEQPPIVAAEDSVVKNEEPPSVGDPTIKALVSVKAPLDHDHLEHLVREVLTPATVGSLTKKLIRQAIAEKLDLDAAAVAEVRPILSDIVEKVINEFNEAEQSPIPKRNPKKRRTPAAPHSESERNSDSAAGDESEDEPKSTRRPVGMRKAQADAMTKASFIANAQTYKSNLGPIEFDLVPREYATGSCGWFYGAKKEFEVDGKQLMCQLTINCTVLGSKSWKKGKPPAAAAVVSSAMDDGSQQEPQA